MNNQTVFGNITAGIRLTPDEYTPKSVICSNTTPCSIIMKSVRKCLKRLQYCEFTILTISYNLLLVINTGHFVYLKTIFVGEVRNYLVRFKNITIYFQYIINILYFWAEISEKVCRPVSTALTAYNTDWNIYGFTVFFFPSKVNIYVSFSVSIF